MFRHGTTSGELIKIVELVRFSLGRSGSSGDYSGYAGLDNCCIHGIAVAEVNENSPLLREILPDHTCVQPTFPRQVTPVRTWR